MMGLPAMPFTMSPRQHAAGGAAEEHIRSPASRRASVRSVDFCA